jgi:hypothetical protein
MELFMNRTRALQLLAQHKAQLAVQFGVTRLALFGSTARDAAREDSDVDVLVAFDGAVSGNRGHGLNMPATDIAAKR